MSVRESRPESTQLPAVELSGAEPSDSDGSVREESSTDVVGFATATAFMAFLVTDALTSQRTAAIVFVSVLVGALGLFAGVAVLVVVVERGRRERREELLQVAVLAVRVAQGQTSSETPASPADRSVEVLELAEGDPAAHRKGPDAG
jgi:hypothetical protein